METGALELDADGCNVNCYMQLKDTEEEGPKVVEHLDEEVPRETNVRCQVCDGHAVKLFSKLCECAAGDLAYTTL